MDNQLNLIFDGNYLFYKSMCVVEGFGNPNKVFLDTQEQVNVLVRKAATDFVSAISKFKNYHKVIFVKDNRSWRKDYYPEYKGNRTKDSKVNWTNMFGALDEFLEILKSKGVLVSCHKGAEGDDLMFLWSDLLKQNKMCNNIIVTGDGDLTQLVDHDENCFTLIYNNNSKLRKFVAKKGFTEAVNNLASLPPKEIDIFSESFDDVILGGNSSIKDIIAGCVVEEIDPNYVALSKALCGDDGDNIPSVWHWELPTGKTKRITKSHLDKVYKAMIERYDEIDMNSIYINTNYHNFIRVQLQSAAKIKIDESKFSENLIRNIALSYLNKIVIPKYIQEEFLEANKDIESFYEYRTEKFDRINLLENTKFAKKSSDGVSSVFKVLERK